MHPDIETVARSLDQLSRDFLERVAVGDILPTATREQDRIRQSLRRRGLVEIAMKPRRWIATAKGLAVGEFLKGEG